MTRFDRSLSLAAAALIASAGSAFAQDISEAADLTAVIALNGKPCGKVISSVKRGENDYLATCEDGNRYRVYVKDGRVVVETAS